MMPPRVLVKLPGLEDVAEPGVEAFHRADFVEDAILDEPDLEDVAVHDVDDLEVLWLVGDVARIAAAIEGEVHLRVGSCRNDELLFAALVKANYGPVMF